MSNVGAQNRFLQSNLNSTGLASETTLKNVCDKLNGTLTVSGTVSIDNYPAIQQVQSNSVNLASEATLSLVNTDTGNIDTKIPSQGQAVMASSLPVVLSSNQSDIAVINGATDLDCNTIQLRGNNISLNNGISDNGCQRVNIASNNSIIGINLQEVNGDAVAFSNGTVNNQTQRVAIASNNSAIPTNIMNLNGNTISVDNGVSDSQTQRVVIASDNSPVNTNIQNLNGNTIDLGIGNANTGTQRIILSTNQPSFENILESNLGINTTSNLIKVHISGYNKNMDDGGLSQVSSGFVNANEFLILPPESGISGFDVVSSNVNDTSLGTGAHFIVITFVNLANTVETKHIITMNGTTPVSSPLLTASDNVRCTGAIVFSTGSTNHNLGRIKIYLTGDDTQIYEQIDVENNISSSARTYISPNLDFYPKYLNINLHSSSLDDLEVYLQMKTSQNNYWKNIQNFLINGNNTTVSNWNMEGIIITASFLSGEPSTKGIDIRFVGQLISAGGASGCSIEMVGYMK